MPSERKEGTNFPEIFLVQICGAGFGFHGDVIKCLQGGHARMTFEKG